MISAYQQVRDNYHEGDSAYQQVRDNYHEGDRHAPGVVGEPATWDVCVRVWEVMTD